ALEGPHRMRGNSEPEADLVGARGHVIAVAIVGVRNPERRDGVVRRDQDVRGSLALRGLVREHEVGRLTGQHRVALGLNPQVAYDSITRLDAVLHEEAVPDV